MVTHLNLKSAASYHKGSHPLLLTGYFATWAGFGAAAYAVGIAMVSPL